jgi:ribose 5-phosphate isomerase B
MIAIGTDHGGFELKEKVCKYLKENDIKFKDFGIYDFNSCDYPDIAEKTCAAVISRECEKAILFCGTGVGISISANKIDGIRAAVCSEYFSTYYSRLHNDANVLCLGGRVIGEGVALSLVDVFLNTEFEGGRHALRVDKIHKLEVK